MEARVQLLLCDYCWEPIEGEGYIDDFDTNDVFCSPECIDARYEFDEDNDYPDYEEECLDQG